MSKELKNKLGETILIKEEDVNNLARLGATYDEMADFFKVSKDTFFYSFRDEVDKAKAEVKIKIRQEQLRVALDPSHKQQVSMLIFLGKVLLGQTEKTETIINASGLEETGAVTFNIIAKGTSIAGGQSGGNTNEKAMEKIVKNKEKI